MSLEIMLVLFLAMLALGTPIAVAMGLAAMAYIFFATNLSGVVVPQLFYNALDHFALLAVPLFILAGELMGQSGITDKIVALNRALIGHLRGGIAQANVLTNMFMAAISGSALADVSAVGSMMIPAMRKEGYVPQFAVAVTACAALMAPIIPPSIVAVVYGSLTGTSIGALFLGGLVPGVMAGIGMLILTWFLSPKVAQERRQRAPAREVGRVVIGAAPAIIMPVIIVGGIVSGVFTPTESAAAAVFYALVYGMVVRRYTGRGLFSGMSNAVTTAASALINLGGAALFSWVLSREGVADSVIALLQSVTEDPMAILFIVIAFLLFLGMFLETLPALILMIPVLQPLQQAMGYDPVHFGILVLMTLVIGAVTPPVGLLGMVAARIGGVTYASTFPYLAPFVVLWIVVVVVVALFPDLVTFVPSQLLN